MLKLQTILELQKTINELNSLADTLVTDFLQLVDDDLFTVDFTAEPFFTEDMVLSFTTRKQLKQKYLTRFCNDFGLTLVSEKKEDNCFIYTFKCEVTD